MVLVCIPILTVSVEKKPWRWRLQILVALYWVEKSKFCMLIIKTKRISQLEKLESGLTKRVLMLFLVEQTQELLLPQPK